MATPVTITSEQTVEVGVNGPDDITRMYIVTGIANPTLTVESQAGGELETQTGTFEAHVGPSLTTAEFRRAVATASLTLLQGQGSGALITEWSVTDVDADYDDDQGKVQLQFDLLVAVVPDTTFAGAIIGGVGFQVIILAASTE
jgi:hypothetical protein